MYWTNELTASIPSQELQPGNLQKGGNRLSSRLVLEGHTDCSHLLVLHTCDSSNGTFFMSTTPETDRFLADTKGVSYILNPTFRKDNPSERHQTDKQRIRQKDRQWSEKSARKGWPEARLLECNRAVYTNT